MSDPDLAEYCRYEGARRGVAPEVVYREEMEARAWLAANPITNEELMRLAAASNPDPRLLEGDEECPFEPQRGDGPTTPPPESALVAELRADNARLREENRRLAESLAQVLPPVRGPL
jgi:hypothetical protein